MHHFFLEVVSMMADPHVGFMEVGQDLRADCGDGVPGPLEGAVPGLPVGLMDDLKTQLLRGE